MKQGIVKCMAAAALSAGSFAAMASGNVVAVNETDSVIHPFYRSNCWGIPVVAGTNGWVNFGGIGPRAMFKWDFTTIIDPTCKNPHVEYTYTVDPDVAQPAKYPQVYQGFRYSTTTNYYLQDGDHIRSFNLLDHDGDYDGGGNDNDNDQGNGNGHGGGH